MEESEPLSEDDRSVELSSIAAIFPEIQIDPSSPFKAALDLPVAPSSPIHVCFEAPDPAMPAVLTPPTSLDVSETDLKSGSKVDLGHPVKDVHILSHLPPLSLEIELPDGYPSEKPPVVHLSINPPWLHPSVLAQLSDDCRRLWDESGKDLVVYTYIDHLQQLAETAFGTQNAPESQVCLSRDLKIALLDFNNKAECAKFEQETFECGVCLEPKKGVNCHRLLRCSHVFCIPCLQDFYNTCITEGDVDSVKCMAPDCSQQQASAEVGAGQSTKRKKRDRTLGPSELLQIPLPWTTVQRYVFLKRKKKIEADKTTVYCPRQWCQGAARSKRHPKPTDPMADDFDVSDDEEGGFIFDPLGDEAQLPPVAERVAICEDCNYAFCSVCKKGWHGELVRCFPRRQAEQTEEEKATEEYLRLYTSPCPTCNVPCQKRLGCNHMRCFLCDTHFCYLCSSWLSAGNPYEHFNDLKSQCYNRLWDLEGGDGLNPDGAEALYQIPDEVLLFDDPPEDDSSEDDDDRPAWEFDSDDDHDHDHEGRRQPPPPAPVPPRGARPRDQRHNANALDPARAAAAERQAQARAMAEVRNRPDARPQRRADPPRGEEEGERDRRAGLQRFLDLVMNDREDEWDSDELDEDF